MMAGFKGVIKCWLARQKSGLYFISSNKPLRIKTSSGDDLAPAPNAMLAMKDIDPWVIQSGAGRQLQPLEFARYRFGGQAKAEPCEGEHAVFLARCQNKTFVLASKEPIRRQVGDTGYVDVFYQPGDPFGTRNICSWGAIAIWGPELDIPPLTYIRASYLSEILDDIPTPASELPYSTIKVSD